MQEEQMKLDQRPQPDQETQLETREDEEEDFYAEEEEERVIPDYEVQKMSWDEIGRFKDYSDAKKFKLATDEVDSPTKIRRRPKVYSVMRGSPLKKVKEKKKEDVGTKKKNAPHKHDKKALKAASKKVDTAESTGEDAT